METKQFEKYQIPKEKLVFANTDSHLTDEKLQTKRVSFARDSFRRFCKNKSSVVAAVILGILILLAIFVPIISPYSTSRVSASEQFLEPKLFEAGTGFWDGTKSYIKSYNLDGSPSGIMYDFANEKPAGTFVKSAVLNLVVDTEPSYINQASQYGKNGYVIFENQSKNYETVKYLNSDDFAVTANGNYTVTIAFGSTEVSEEVFGEYRVLFTDGETVLVLRDWSKNISDATFDISAAVAEAGLQSLKGSISFELKGDAEAYSYILIKSCEISANESVSNYDELATYGFTDATAMVLVARDEYGVYPEGYWSCSGRKGVYASEVYYCSFVYDTYEAAYGNSEVVYAASDFQKLIDQGLCSYDASIGPESFQILSEDCPIESISSQSISRIGKLLSVTAQCPKYKTMGYDEMPKFILGTDASGIDVFTRMFAGLRTSLILGVCTFAFCFMFGLVWGSISGYFGGWVDLTMERFCDILGGVPWIVVMTLAILHFGNNFLTFFLALCMTGWMGTSARTRTQFYRFKNMEYILASRTLGSKDLRLIFKHILPNSLGTIITSSVLMIPSVIFSEATLAYLNLGLQGVASFGVMLSDNQQYIQSHSFLIVWPSAIMALLMISFNLFGNGLRDAVNPTLKGA